VFDRIRKLRKLEGPTAATAEQAFQNIDVPLATGIERWKNAIAMRDNFSAPFELATLAEQRDKLVSWQPSIMRKPSAFCPIGDRCW
jgi:hypothetical protein